MRWISLHRENLRLIDRRRLCKQFISPGEERFGNVARKVRVAALLIRERVEDAEAIGPELERGPAHRACFALRHRQRRGEKLFDFLLFARLRLEYRENSKLFHDRSR